MELFLLMSIFWTLCFLVGLVIGLRR